MKTDLDIFCKYYEMRENQKLMAGLPVIIRLDGKTFHNFTKGMKRPYDERLSSLMGETLKYLMKETSACIGYTQSDEISLLLWNPLGDIYFSAKPYKINSVLASRCSLFFNKNLEKFGLKDFSDREPVFDCRCFSIPKENVHKVFAWRYLDAVRNSVSMAAYSVFSHKECFKKSTKDLHEMLFSKGINWANYPSFFKNGQFMLRTKRFLPFSAEELEKLPEKHKARENPEMKVERNVIELINVTNFNDIGNQIIGVLK